MELDLSSLHLLAEAASLVFEEKLSLVPSIFDRDDEKKFTVVTTTFGPTVVGWIVRKKRSPRARGLTFQAQKLNSDPVVQKKKRSCAFHSTETQEPGRVSKKPKKTQKTGLTALVGPSKWPTKYMDKIQDMCSRDLTLVVEKTLTAIDMNRGQSRLPIPKEQLRECFLKDQEIRTLDSKEGIKVSLIDLCHKGTSQVANQEVELREQNFFLCIDQAVECDHPSLQAEQTRKGCSRPAFVI